MRTRSTSPAAAPIPDGLLVAEEVVLTVGTAAQGRRVLMAFALTFIANALRVGVNFELRRLSGEVIATYDGDRLRTRAEIEAVLPSLSGFLDRFSEELATQVAQSVIPKVTPG